MKFDLIIVGVGGQGVILASDIIGRSAVKEGMPVRSAETHGMAQRGGSVENHIRIGINFGPLIPEGDADALLGFEPVEAIRCSHLLSRDGIAIINTERIIPVSVSSGAFTYPDVESLFKEVKKVFRNVITLNATKIAKKAGDVMTANTVMLGVLARYLPIKEKTIIQTLKESVPKSLLEANLKAFELGKGLI